MHAVPETSVVDRIVARVTAQTVKHLAELHIPELEQVICHRSGDQITLWLVFPAYPLQWASQIYALESDLILGLPGYYVYGQDLEQVEDIPADSLRIEMAA